MYTLFFFTTIFYLIVKINFIIIFSFFYITCTNSLIKYHKKFKLLLSLLSL